MGAGRVPEAVIGPKLRRGGTLLDVIDRTEVLRHLVRIDTTSGNERAGIEVTAAVLDRIISRDETRPDPVAWLPGRGTAPPLLVQGHIDVVPRDGLLSRYDGAVR